MHCNGTFTLNMGVWCNAQYLIFRGFSFFFGKTYLSHWGPAENPWGFAATLEDPGESPAKNFGIGWGEGEGGKWQQKRTKACLLPCLYEEEEKQYRIDFLFMCLSANTSAASFAHFLHSLLGPPRLCAPGWNKKGFKFKFLFLPSDSDPRSSSRCESGCEPFLVAFWGTPVSLKTPPLSLLIDLKFLHFYFLFNLMLLPPLSAYSLSPPLPRLWHMW